MLNISISLVLTIQEILKNEKVNKKISQNVLILSSIKNH